MKYWNKMHEKLYEFFINLLGVDNDTSKNLYKLFRFAIYAISIIFIINIIFNKESFGAWGDFFGGVLNPILTFLTFMGLLITIIIQQTELREAREEFKGQKIEMQVQSFDNKFFQMMNFFIEIRKEIDFSDIRSKFECGIEEDYEKNKKYISHTLFNFFYNQFQKFNGEKSEFKYYFLNLYQILKYIDEDIPNQELSKKYTNFLRAQLSKDELILLTYNAIGVQSFTTKDYQILVEKYEFFEHLEFHDFNSNIQKIIDCVLSKYDIKVFGKNESFNELLNYENDCDKK